MISISARGGIDIYTIIDQLNSTGSCPSYTVRRATKQDTSKGSCCPMAVGNALLDMYNEVQRELAEKNGTEPKKQPPKKAPKPKAVKNINKRVSSVRSAANRWFLRADAMSARAAAGANVSNLTL